MTSSQKLCIERSVQDSHHYFPLTPSLYFHFFNHWLTALTTFFFFFTNKNNLVWVILKCHRMNLLWSLKPNTIYISKLIQQNNACKEHCFFFFFFFYIREEWKKAHQGIWGAVREIKQQTGRKKLPQAFNAMQRTFENLTKTLIEIMLIE